MGVGSGRAQPVGRARRGASAATDGLASMSASRPAPCVRGPCTRAAPTAAPPKPPAGRYKGHPHWGKNHHRTFTHPGCPVRGLYPRFQEFLEIKGRLDPKRIFEPPLFSKILAGAPPSYGPRCALSGECFCKEDAHCGQGRKCVASAAFPEYKACRRAGTY